MTYEAFKQRLLKSLQEFFPHGTHISIRQFPHNNHIILDGLTILEPGSNVSPTIYLNHYYGHYQKGSTFASLQSKILQYYFDHSSVRTVDTSFFSHFDNIRARIAYKLIHYGKNKELLAEIPHLPFLDLAIIFYCLMQSGNSSHASILIYNEHLAYWDIPKEALFALAQKNTPLLLPHTFDSLADLILPTMKMLPDEGRHTAQKPLDSEMVPMYVLTNRQRLNGACCILYPDVLGQIANQFQDSLYILPSSIHEVIILPASCAGDATELADLVREVNLTEVSPEEILSDSVYCYNQEDGKISKI